MKSFGILCVFMSSAFSSPTFLSPDAQLSIGEVDAGFEAAWLSERRLIEIPGNPPKWVTELEKIELKRGGQDFFDITEVPHMPKVLSMLPLAYPKPTLAGIVKDIFYHISTEAPRRNLEILTSFPTRDYRSEHGQASQQWLFETIKNTTAEFASASLRKHVTVSEFHHSWKQNSIIASIQGSSTSDERIVIIGAHQDSTNVWPFEPAPGADDDGSGTVTILEAYRALLVHGFRQERTVEFHWYSAEEGGLLGSLAVAADYASRGKQVYAMLQNDMTAWIPKGTQELIGIIRDKNFTNDVLSNYLKVLIDTYLDISYVDSACGQICSDHSSWTKAGYPASFVIESAFENTNPHVHSFDDRIDVSEEFSFDHMLQFSKLDVAFAVELGGITKE